MVNVAREAMMSIGCIQSQKCHTDRCPTGVATQDPWLAHGLDPASKSERCAQYVRTFRKELVKVSEAIGVAHPGLITAEDVDIFSGDYEARSLRAVYGYKEGWGTLGPRPGPRDHRADGPRRLPPRDPLDRGGRGREADRPRHPARTTRASDRRTRLVAYDRRAGRVVFEWVGWAPDRASRKAEAQWETSFSATVLRIARIRRDRSFGSAW